MCYYDQIKYSCDHHSWGRLRRYCDEALAIANRSLDIVDVSKLPACERKQVYKHIYDPQGRKCTSCRYQATSEDVKPEKVRLQDYGALEVYDVKHLENFPCWLQAGPFLGNWWEWCLGRDALRTYKGVPQSNTTASFGEFEATMLRNVAARFVSIIKARNMRMQSLNSVVLRSLGLSNQRASFSFRGQNPKRQLVLRLAPIAAPWEGKQAKTSVQFSPSLLNKPPDSIYTKLSITKHEVRLFELLPSQSSQVVSGAFKYVELASSSDYIAVSYTWGDGASAWKIPLSDGSVLFVRENLWWFLRTQSRLITRPTLFWIDAICINQSDIVERNFQVGLMKLIYANADEVYAWLGRESNDSDVAMDFVHKRGAKRLRSRGPGYHCPWSPELGRALYAVCERQYWRRMW